MVDTFTWIPVTGQPDSVAANCVKLRLMDLGDGTHAFASLTVDAGGLSTHIAGAATTVVKSGAGVLRRLVINKAVASSSITIYDSLTASGTVIAIITNPLVLLTSQNELPYNARFSTGLTVVTSAADDVTVVYT